MKNPLFSLVLLLSCATVSAARVDTVAVFSPKMQRGIPALVVVPDGRAGERLPVLYLLHGYAGDHFTWHHVICDLRPLADDYGMMIVCPYGENSWYWDSPQNPASQFETFVAQELPDWIDAHYPTARVREARAITGYSMGGHGALWVAMRHKDRFGAAGSTSGGVDIRPFPEQWEMKAQLGELRDNPARWDAHTVMTQAETLRNGELALVIDCGYDDFFFEVNDRLHEKLLAQGVEHDYLTRPGIHDGVYWSTSLPYQALFFHRYFQAQQWRMLPVAEGLRVVFMGDSITDGNWGKGDGRPAAERNLTDRNHLYGSGYMYLCAATLQSLYPERGHLFFNRGVSGNALDDLAARWQTDALDTRPDVLSVLVGTNDVERYLHMRGQAAEPSRVPDFDFAAWERRFRELLDASRRDNPALKIVLCTPFVVRSGRLAGEPTFELRARLVDECAATIRRLAADYGATLVDLNAVVGALEAPHGDTTYWVWDGIHPTPACHRRMADAWLDAVMRDRLLE